MTDNQPIEVGVKFRSEVAGWIKGIRFYKGAANTGTHVGHLWTADGTPLANATFTAETASGWQQVDFGTPVPIAADTTYIASYYSESGYFAIDAGYFTSAGVDTPPLHALQAGGLNGPNGVYRYGDSGFPSGGSAANYWVDVAFVTEIDTTAPTITGRTPAPGATGVPASSNVTVGFDEPMNPTTVTTSTVTLRAQGAGSDVPATVTYAGTTATLDPIADLAPSTQYTVTVAATVADTSGNQLGTADTWTFTTSVPLSSLVDTTVADFDAGSPGSTTYVSETGNGEVILAPTVGAEFSGSSLPSGWTTNPWAGGGGAVVAGGSVTVDQAAIWTNTLFAPGRSLEFVANFSDPNQHIGFANDFNSGDWAIFSSGASGDQLYARSNVPGGVDTPLGAGYLDGLHRFRIEWTATSARYFVDGIQVAFHTGLTFSANLRPAASDANASGSLAIDWMRMSPYPASGTFTSRVHDAGVAVDWRTLDGTATSPAGTGIAFEVRTGDTPTPDGTWSDFAPVADGADIPGTSRYIQYRATLTTGDTGVTPSLEQVALGYVAPVDETAPTITARSPNPSATGVAVGSSVGVTFSESIDPATVTAGSVRLRAQGAGADVPADTRASSAPRRPSTRAPTSIRTRPTPSRSRRPSPTSPATRWPPPRPGRSPRATSRPASWTRPSPTSVPVRPVPPPTSLRRVTANSSSHPRSARSSAGRICPAAGRAETGPAARARSRAAASPSMARGREQSRPTTRGTCSSSGRPSRMSPSPTPASRST